MATVEAAKIVIDIQTNADKAAKRMVKLDNAQEQVSKGSKKVGLAVKAIPFAAAAAAGVIAFKKISGAVKENINLFREQERAEKKLEAVIRATGGSAGFTAEQLKKQASALQDVTTFGDEAIIGSQAILATFKSIQGVNFKRAQKSILDLSAAFGTDLKGSTIQVAKALEDPIKGLSALSRVGVTFSEQQKEQIKLYQESGDLASAQSIILETLEGQVGGVAEALAAGSGKWEQFNNRISDNKELLGEAAVNIGDLFAPAVDAAIDLVADFATNLVELSRSFDPVKEAQNELIDIQEKFSQASNLDGLVSRYDELAGKAELSAEEQRELNGLVEEIAALAPGAVTEIDKFGNALSISSDGAKDFADELRRVAELEILTQLTALKREQADNAKEAERLGEKYEDLTRILENFEGPSVYAGIDLINERVKDQIGLFTSTEKKAQIYREAIDELAKEFPELATAINEASKEVPQLEQVVGNFGQTSIVAKSDAQILIEAINALSAESDLFEKQGDKANRQLEKLSQAELRAAQIELLEKQLKQLQETGAETTGALDALNEATGGGEGAELANTNAQILNDLISERRDIILELAAIEQIGNLANIENQDALIERLREINSLLDESANKKTRDTEVTAKQKEEVDKWLGALSEGVNILSGVSDLVQAVGERDIQRLEQSGATEEQVAKKRKELKIKQARFDKATALFNAGINTASAVTAALTIPPPAGFILAGLAAAAGAVEIGTIAATPLPAAQFGGSFVVPPGNEADSGLLKVNSGEQVDVTPTRFTGESNRMEKMVVNIGGRDFDAFLEDRLNSGAIKIRRKGVVVA